jgi:hypothetical protein
LDRIQVVFAGHRASFEPLPIKVSDDAMAILMNLIRSWLCIKGHPDDEINLAELRHLLKETVPE